MSRRATHAPAGASEHELFCACAPGLEPLLLREVRALGLDGEALGGGVQLRGTLETAARLNLWLRTASRVLLRLGRFEATNFNDLVKKAKALSLERVVRPGAPVSWKVTCKKSRLYHSDAVAERLHGVLEETLGRRSARLKPSEDDADSPAQQLFVRFEHDVCTVSADTSGALLHLRGTRPQISAAPLRETLAAALLLHAGYEGGPLLDPLCGAGTIVLEAALIARRRAPGLLRTFALLGWPGFDAGAWARLVDGARTQERPAEASLAGSDVDAKAIAAAQANARVAGLDELRFEVRALGELPSEPGPGLVAANPPYGQRVGAQGADPHALVRQLSRLVRERRPAQALAVIAPLDLVSAAGALHGALRTTNGGLDVRLGLAR